MKRILLLFMIFALLCPTIIACNGSTSVIDSSEQTTSESDVTEAITTQADEESTSEETTRADEATTTDAEQDPPISILFIGNSYTYYNDMPLFLFKQIAISGEKNVTVRSITKGSYTLEKFSDPSDEYGKKVEEYLNKYTFDYVVIQEQSTRPILDPDRFYSAVRNLCDRIRAKGAQPVLYSTWGRETGNSTLTKNGWTNESMTWKIAAAYQAIGDELDIPVAYAGLAFFDVYTDPESEISIYASDKHHSSPKGSYLAALTIYATIFNEDPTGIDFIYTFPDNEAAILKEAAKNAVFHTPQIPEQYKTSSTN